MALSKEDEIGISDLNTYLLPEHASLVTAHHNATRKDEPEVFWETREKNAKQRANMLNDAETTVDEMSVAELNEFINSCKAEIQRLEVTKGALAAAIRFAKGRALKFEES